MSEEPTSPPDGPSPSDGPSQAALTLVRELERHVASGGWDGPVRLFALVRTAGALERDPQLADRLPPEVVAAARADADHLTAVEQEDLPQVDDLDALVAMLAWPPTVDGVALSVERVVLPPDAEPPQGEDGAAAEPPETPAHEHPAGRDVRLVAAVLRGGVNGCAIRSREHDSDALVAVGPDLVPELVAALADTLV